MEGHGRELPYWYVKKIARELHITPKDLGEFQDCTKDQSWLLGWLREIGVIRPRAE